MSGSQSALYGGGGKTLKFQEFLTSGTFTPSAKLLAAGGLVELDLRGSGGGGSSSSSGGGGGSSKLRTFVVVTGPVSVIIASSAPQATAGGNSTFGSLATAVGGGTVVSIYGGGSAGSQGVPGGTGISSLSLPGVGGGEGGGAAGAAGSPNSGGGGGGRGVGAAGGGWRLWLLPCDVVGVINMKYAKIDNGVVENVILADAEFVAGLPGVWVDCVGMECGMGWSYDGAAFHASAPSEPAVLRHISVGAFYDRFGAAKWAILADTTPGVVAVIRDASVRAYIDLDNPQLPAGLAIITAAGHTFDADSVINEPVLDGERP